MTETNILYINIALYTCFTFYFYLKYGFKNLSTIASGAYLVCSIVSLLYYNTPLFLISFSNTNEIKWEGMLWLAIFNFLSCNLLRGFGFQVNTTITGYNDTFFRRLQKFIIILSLITLIVQLPSAIMNLLTGNLSDIRNATYTDGALVSSNIVVNLIGRIFGGLNVLLLIIPAFNYFVLHNFKKIDIYSLIIYFLLFICTMGAYVSRSIIVFRLIDCVILYILLINYIKFKNLKYILFLIIPIGFLLSNIFSAITSSRFGDSAFNKTAEMAANLRYTGEAQINFMSMMYDETTNNAYGYRSLPLFRKAFGLNYFGQYGIAKEDNLEYLDKIHPYPNYIFYTAGGDMYLDWGKYLPIIVLILLNVTYYKIKRKDNFQLLLWEYFISFFVIYGVFYASYQNESSNFLLLFLIYIYYKYYNKKIVLARKNNESLDKIINTSK